MSGLSESDVRILRALPLKKLKIFWDEMEAAGRRAKNLEGVVRELCCVDLFYLLVMVCRRIDMWHPWIYERCREVEAEPNECVDLWFREGYKSTIKTFGLTIQDILKDPEVTFGFFSHTRPIAKAFLRQIMRELETNIVLHRAFPDVLWGQDTKQAPKWSEDDGIIVKRKSNPNEATIEAWGLVDGQPTSKHFRVLNYDDIVTDKSVTTPEMIEKTTDALALSYNLGARGGVRRWTGTFYHFGDTYKQIILRNTAKPRIHPATDDGTETGKSVLLTDEQLRKKRADMGPYIFGCFPAGVKVLTAQWTERPIEDLVPGDMVIGYTFPGSDKSRLVETPILSTKNRIAEVVRFRFESGRVIDCTPDHKFFSGRRGPDVGGKDTHHAYSVLGLGYRDLHAACPVYDPRLLHCPDELAAAWLSGLWDGEGAVSANTITISQSPEHNPAVCERIEKTLSLLGFDYGTHNRPANRNNGRKSKVGRIYYIRGGRQEKMRFLNICKPARSWKIVDALRSGNSRNFGKVMRDKVVSVESLGEWRVFNIQTEAGNYVADGYAVKNCQMLLNPKADALQGFKREWLRYYKNLPAAHIKKMNIYILVDAANAKRKESDYTAMWVIGLNVDQNYYALEIVRDRLNLPERVARVIGLHRKYKGLGSQVKGVRYERYGMMADIDAIKTAQEAENYRFDIQEVGGQTPKDDRIKRLLPIFEAGRFYLMESLHVTDWQKTTHDLVHDFVEQEYYPFPVSVHKDMLDSLSRIAEPDLSLVWPKEHKIEAPYVPRVRAVGENAVGWMA